MSFDDNLKAYADLIVKIGLNFQRGQELLVDGRGSPETMIPLMRHIARSAYRAGATYVDIIWSDELQELIRLEEADPETLDYFPAWRLSRLMTAMENQGATMGIMSVDPNLMAGQDPAGISRMDHARRSGLRPWIEKLRRNEFNWLGVAVPGESWARQVFPDLPEDERVPKLWEAVFKALRLDQDDPVAAWENHIEVLAEKTRTLNERQYRALKFSGPGTDLTIGLVPGHRWVGGRTNTVDGIGFVPNMPTEEVFTIPDRALAEGVVHTAKPLNLQGLLIDSFSMRFKDGQVVEIECDDPAGQELLERLIDNDEGATRLGEVALVPHSSPISQSGLLFYNTLFDENAASHIALGDSYRFCFPGSEALSSEEYIAAGGNESNIHVDFMIGSEKLDVDGIKKDGGREAVMRAGEWV